MDMRILNEVLLRIKFVILGRSWDQRWFWTKEWQSGERQVDADMAAGRFTEYDNMDDFLEDLKP